MRHCNLPVAFFDLILRCAGLDAQLVVELGFFDHGQDGSVCLVQSTSQLTDVMLTAAGVESACSDWNFVCDFWFFFMFEPLRVLRN